MSLPDLPRGDALSLRPRAELDRAKRNARLAALTATLGLFGWKADTAPTSLALIVARTADLSDADFLAALDHIADKWEAIGNPIPAIRRAAHENGAMRAQRLRDEADKAHAAVVAREREAGLVPVPMPEKLRSRFGTVLRDAAPADEATERAKKLEAKRKLASVLSDATNPTDARAREGAGT